MKVLLRPIYHRLHSLVGAPRARRIVARYTEHHRQATKLWHADGHTGEPVQLSGIMRVQRPGESNHFNLPIDWSQRVQTLAQSAADALERTDQCLFLPRIDRNQMPARCSDLPAFSARQLLAINIRDPLRLAGLEAVIAPLANYASQHLFASYTIVDKIYVYRNPIAAIQDQVSWRWHYDNHPDQILKFMVYLTDVSETTGPIGYLAGEHGAAWCKPQPLAADTWISPSRLAAYETKGYRPACVTGSAGTVILFDNNIIHKANQAKTGHRDVVVCQLRPANITIDQPIDRQWTGSFLHEDFNVDPFQHHVIDKRGVHSG